MEDWQRDVLINDYLRVIDHNGHIIISATSPDNAMAIQEVIKTIRHDKRKPVIMCPFKFGCGKFAPKKSVLSVLQERIDGGVKND